MDRYELAWAAGFFDGEGWAGVVRQAGRRIVQPHARINQAGDSGVPEVLTRFSTAVGMGRLGGPYRKEGRRDLYRWEISNRKDVVTLLRSLSPWLGTIKMRALANAVGENTPPTSSVVADDVWSAWAAGLYDGEGCSALLRHRSHEGYLMPELSVTQASPAGLPEVLVRFREIVAAGGISGPYDQRSAKMLVYRWKVAAQGDAVRVIQQLWPFLGVVKREQAQRVLDTLTSQPALPRGNPEWGSNKVYCVNGHEYATARIRPFVPRNGGTEPRASSGCLQCLREYARRRREEKKSSAPDDDRRSLSEREMAYGYLLK
ncbi:MAG TPA: hypothetical protein VI814_13860 [Candidatus Limnocylindria bacterium]